jgi:hypothetical protein
MKVDGRCHCGRITFTAEIDPDKAMICHCEDCQTLSGSAFRTVVPTQPGTFRLLSGEPTIYVKVGESGTPRQQSFCANCGSPIYSGTLDEAAAGKVHSLRVGALRQRRAIVPKVQIWCRSEQPWLDQRGTMRRVDKQPQFGAGGAFPSEDTAETRR